jgi:hypothetical protein
LVEFTSENIVEETLELVKRYMPMETDCRHYSKTMELLALRKNLEKGISDDTERQRTRKRIEDLERELELD